MSQMITFLSNASSSCSTTRAVKPVVYQKSMTIAVGAGANLQDLQAQIATGQCAADAGQLVNKGCYDLLVSLTYLDGADCDNCTVDTLTTQVITIIVPANAAFPLPPGLITRLQVATVDSTGAQVANTTEQTVSWYSAYSPDCNGCVLVP